MFPKVAQKSIQQFYLKTDVFKNITNDTKYWDFYFYENMSPRINRSIWSRWPRVRPQEDVFLSNQS